MMRIGCGTVCFRKLSLDEAMQRIARAGYEYVEPQATAPFCPHVDPWHDDPEQFRRRVAELGFKGASALWAPNGAIIRDPESVRGVTQAIRWAAAAGIPVVNCGDGNRPAEMTDADALACLRDRLAQILAVAQECQVYVAIEPHGTFSLTAEGLKKILALSDSRWLGVNYDAANVRRATYVETVAGAYSWTPFGERQDEVATLAAVADRVVHFHAKDLRDGKCVALGMGDVNNQDCLAVLQRQGYAGVLSLETEGEDTPDEGQRLVEASRAYLVRALQELS
jgi:sugar phosphate isomerase/epimerase